MKLAGRRVALLFIVATLSQPAFSVVSKVLKNSPIFSRTPQGKITRIGEVRVGEIVDVLNQSKGGNFLLIRRQNTMAYVDKNAIQGYERTAASISERVLVDRNSSFLSIHGGGIYQSASYQAGGGGGIYVHVPAFGAASAFALDAGPSAYYFPSLSSGLTGLEVFGTARLHYHFAKDMDFGVEAGAAYVKVSGTITDPLLISLGISGAVDESTLGFVGGVVYRWEFLPHLMAQLTGRVISADGAAASGTLGLEYRF